MVHLRLLSSKMDNSQDEQNNVYDGQKLLLIVAMLTGKINASLLSRNIKLLQTSFDLMTDRCHQ